MRPESHRKALLAAARIAAGAALLSGCAGGAAPPPEPTAEPARTEPAPTDPAVVGTPMDPTPSPELASCVDVVNKVDFGAKELPADAADCCKKLAEDADKRGSLTFPHRDECCAANGWQGTSACTPWGPPTPPAMVA